MQTVKAGFFLALIAIAIVWPFAVRASAQAPTASTSSATLTSAPEIKILTPTPAAPSIDDGEVVPEAIGNSTWLGLYKDGDSYRWKPAEVRIDPPPAAKTPARNSKDSWSGKQIIVTGDKTPVILVQGLPSLASVSPKAAHYSAKPEEAISPEGTEIEFGGSTYVLRLLSPLQDREFFRLLLTSGSESQVVDNRRFINDSHWSLRWAGDLDGDGKLDLLVEYADAASARLYLMLSTRAKSSEMLHPVAKRDYAAN